MRRVTLLAALVPLLAACGVPSAVVVTTYAVDGVTYVSTGKSLSGHALSAATDKDCSILFGITRGELCKDKERRDEQAHNDASLKVPKYQPPSSDEATGYGQTAAAQPVLEPKFFDFEYETPPEPKAAAPVAAKPQSDKTNPTQWTLVLGSFAEHRHADDLARRLKPDPGLVTAINVDGAVRYLVVTPPLKRDQSVGHQLNIADLNLEKVKLMPVCNGPAGDENCVALDGATAVQQATLP